MIPRRFAGIACALSAAALAGHSAGAQAAFELASPTGRYQVGTTTWRLTDASRKETFSGSREFRQVEVLAWYPTAAAPQGATAPYLRHGLSEVRTLAQRLRAPAAVFDELAKVQTHAVTDGVPDATPRKRPLLLFSHGYIGSPSASTALLEDLASHGYVVLSVVHPYEATAATLVDGRVVSFEDNGAPRQDVRAVIGEWGSEDEAMAAVTRAADQGEQLRLMRQYLSSLRDTNVALRRWVNDTRLVLDRLSGLPGTSVPGRLAAMVDMNRVGAFGHSMGGVAAGQFCLEDRRCRAGLNLDGIPQYGTMIDTPLRRPFLMVYSGRPGRAGASDVIYRRANSSYFRVDVRETLHLDFTDMAFWGGPLRERAMLGTIAPARAAVITAAIVREYFGQELLGEPSPLLRDKPAFPEVTVTRGKWSR